MEYKIGLWSLNDTEYLRKNYSKKSVIEISEFLSRSIKSVRNKADFEGLMSRSRTQRARNMNVALNLIRNGERCKYKLAKISSLDLTLVSAMITEFLNESSLSQKPQYYESEQAIFDSMELEYKAEDLKGWELNCLNKIED